ncbi:hypothetical protein [Achromobacter insolitus]|uniref:hypothetical protein n=1 Tax=Achromobacter insolitus TaxID=217204 RepID=UPI0007C39B63|nr:hypothetical protein [Achromobacter insolitus]OAD16422.1 hypothetical protein A3839_28105 [Achromobacter insolitus]
MAILNKSKRAAKFVFIDMPLGVLGVSQLRLGNRVIRDLWSSLRSVVCPQCKRGILECMKDEVVSSERDSVVRHPWVCTGCGFALLEVADTRVVQETVRSMRNQEAIETLGELEFAERRRRARHFAVQARVFFLLGFAAFGWFLYQVAIGAGWIYSANLASLGLACTVVGLKASYRSWQVETGTVFVEGAFLHFLRHERWLR